MAIDKSGELWVGSDAADIAEYLREAQAQGYVPDEIRVCKCGCGSTEFKLEADAEEGCAQRSCIACGAAHLICDSAEYWDDSEPAPVACAACGAEDFNLAVGFSLYDAQGDEARDVRWLSVGSRCLSCGTLDLPVDWKVGYGPSHQLLDLA